MFINLMGFLNGKITSLINISIAEGQPSFESSKAVVDKVCSQ